MPSFIDKLHTKSSTTKPVLQKLYATPKKWLTSNQKKNTTKTDKIQADDIPKQGPNIIKVRVSSEHSYENIEFSKENSTTNKAETISNVTVIEVVPSKPQDTNKLKSAIDNFDKILSEYGKEEKSGRRTMPKLQKSRTCSIIESKCILKKSSLQNLDKKGSRSLENLTSLDTNSKNVAKITIKKNTDKPPIKTNKAPQTSPMTKSNCKNGIKVKEVVKKINSLSDQHSKKEKPPPSKDNLVEQIVEKPKHKLSLPKSVSSLDISSQSAKKSFASKIPVKSSLNRTFPSTPTGLNVLDRKLGSTQNLNGKIEDKRRLSESVQNLKSISTSSKPINRSNNNLSGKTFRVQRMVKANSVHNLGAKFVKSELSLPPGKEDLPNKSNLVRKSSEVAKNKSTQNLLDINRTSPSCNSFKKYFEEDSAKTQSNLNLTELSINKINTDIPTKKSRVENLTKTANQIHSGSKAVATPKKHLVNSAVEKFEKSIGSDKSIKARLNTDTYKKITPKVKRIEDDNDTFGVKKAQYEPKFAQVSLNKVNQKSNINKKSETFKKPNNNNAVDGSLTKYTKKDWSNIEKNDLRKAREFVETINFVTTCDNSPLNSKGSTIVDEILVNLTAKEEVKDMDGKVDEQICSNNYAKNNINNNKVNLNNNKVLIGDEISKVKDYSSDDNSDDSGNISNEHIADLSSLTSSSRNNSFDSLPSISRSSMKLSITPNNVVFNNLNNSLDRSIDEEEIFFRSGVLTQLETQRDERLAGMVINLQSHCRGYLARKKLTQRKLQDLAVRCIQRNVRKFMVVRDWPWWRLLVRVTPLLNVHRTEEELKNKTEELELLRAKVDKLDSERTALKHENDKLEAKLSELTADLAEEHSTSTLAAERLDAETSERMRIERELTEVQSKNKLLQDASERLEMELLYAKSELNGISEEDEDGDGDSSIYKQRYERAKKELEFTKKRLQQQHEDDLEQLVGLKKQLEKKLTDAYEEVEEQRQVVGQWKRKVQKLNGETNDLRLLLEEQNARNNLLEKKQRKFDAETQLLQDEFRQEKQAKDRLVREKEAILAEKYTIESSLADVRLELDLKHDKLQALQRELDELTYGGKTEEEVTILRKQKIDCERRIHDQDEELDELAGQVQLLEQAKLRLEMTLEHQRKEGKKEAQQRDEELEEVRCNAQKKVKALEAQLENEHEERTILLREKHELERRLTALTESDRNDRAGDEALLHRLKRDLKRTKVLLRDTQSQLERLKADSPGKALIRQLRNQIEDLECARSVAVKSKQSLEAELCETQAMLDEANKQKSEAEDKANAISRERSDLQAQIEENEEELAEVMKKYKATVQQMSLDQISLQEQVSLVSELETEKNHLRDQLAELASKLESVENMGEASSNLHLKRMELKTKELESKLELEQTTRSRLEVQIARLKEAVDKLQTDICNSRTKEQAAQEQIRKLQRSLRELKEEHNNSLAKEAEFVQKRKDLEKRCEIAETETAAAKADVKLALKRIEDLQSAIQGELEDTPSEHTDSEQDSYTSDESVSTFLSNSKTNSTLKTDRNSTQFDSRRLSNASRSSTSSSMHGKDYSYA